MSNSESRPIDHMGVLADQLPSMLAYWDKDLRCRFANRAYEAWFAADPDALLGTSIRDLLGPELFKRNEPYIRAALAGETQSFERFVPHPGGGGRHSLATYIPHRVEGEIVGFTVQVTDVSALKATEAALRAEIAGHRHALDRLQRSEASLRQAQRLGQIGSWEWEVETDIVSWSEELYRIFGQDPKRLPPSYARHDQVYTPDSLVVLRRAVGQALAEGRGYETELEYVRPDGTTGWVLARGEAVRDEGGKVVALRGVAQDITARRELLSARAERDAAHASSRALLERELNQSSCFQALFEQGPYFTTVLSPDGTVIDANHACMEAGGYRLDEVIGRKFWECGWWAHSADLVAAVRHGVERAAQGASSRREQSFFSSDGLERLTDLVIVPVKDEKGRVMFIATIGIDISDRKHAEEELRQLAYRLAKMDEQKGTFLATLAHEMLNILSPVKAGLHLMKQAGSTPDAVDRARDVVTRHIDHLSRLVSDLFDTARISSGKLKLEREPVDLQSVLDLALQISSAPLQAAHVAASLRVPTEPVTLSLDPLRMAQVFSNLINNAAKFSAPGGRVEIAVERAGDRVVVTVADEGVGMTAGELDSVFQMFAQGVRSSEGQAVNPGIGIGLSLVRSIVQAHRGTVHAVSPGLGMGSTFTVSLPLC